MDPNTTRKIADLGESLLPLLPGGALLVPVAKAARDLLDDIPEDQRTPQTDAARAAFEDAVCAHADRTAASLG